MEYRNIADIKANPKNPRTIKDDRFKKLCQSLTDFPEMLEKRPLVCFTDTDKKAVVLGGNMRLKAAIEIGLKKLPVVMADDWTEEQKARFLISDNVGFGDWNYDELQADWDVQQLEDWGLDIPQQFMVAPEAEEDDFDVPEGGIETDIVLGDLFEIGEHRLLCGDSTCSDTVAKLMDGQKADMVFTDPPYGIGYEYNSHKDQKGEQYLKFCDVWFNNLLLISEFIVISTGWAYQKYWWNKDPKDCMYWLARNKQTGGTVFHFRRIEPFFVWGKPKNKYNFDFFEVTTEREDGLRKLHSCPKPLPLISDIISGVGVGGLITDIFLGSGTTMVAAHQLKRKCYGMELDPKYCQVIVDRMKKLDPNLVIKKNGHAI